jgi:FkbM family methyltransferase
VRRAATAPGVRALIHVTPVIRATGALRASLVRERRRFARNELRARDVTAGYTLRTGGRPVVIRHHSSDVMILDEIFGAHEYDPPPGVVDALADVPAPRILDLGANVGLFGVWALDRWPGAHVHGYEPDPDNAAIHRRTMELNAAGERWSLSQAFAACANGRIRFAGGTGSASRAAALAEDDPAVSIEVEARDVFADLAASDLVKIDIEGGEWELLQDARFRELRARAVFVEYHPFGAPTDDPGAEAERLVRAAGFEARHDPKPLTPGWGVVWGWRRP